MIFQRQINFSRSLNVQPGSFNANETASSSGIPMYLENSDTDIDVYARLMSSIDLSRTTSAIKINENRLAHTCNVPYQ